MFIDASEIQKNAQIGTDVCIVGAGAAGITLARELIGQSFDVCLLESGGLEFDIPTQMLYHGTSVGVTYLPLEATRLRYFGGTTNHWGGASRPLDPIDFERREWVPDSGWPFDRTHLEPYYRRAQPVLELGPFAYRVEEWEGADIYPPADFDDRVLKNAFLQNSSPPTRFGQLYREELRRAPNMRTYLHANVLEIETIGNGNAVRRLRVSSLARNDFFVTARLYVIATGGIENARLLLLSDRVNPRGVGNTNGLVGRYFMEHPHFHHSKPATLLAPGFPYRFYMVRNRVTHPAFPETPAEVWGFVAPTEEALRRHALLNFGIAVVVAAQPPVEGIESARTFKRALTEADWPDDFWEHVGNVIADFDDVAALAYRKITGQAQPLKIFDVAYWTEQRPNPESRVYLSDERDALGQRRIVFDWRLTEQDRETMRTALRLFAQELGKAGLGRLRIAPAVLGDHPESMLQPSFHHMGTTRMHVDPKRGVVDRNCRMHEVSNLYIAGSSVFPTVGHANPTITITALTLRLADHLEHVMKQAPEVVEVTQ